MIQEGLLPPRPPASPGSKGRALAGPAAVAGEGGGLQVQGPRRPRDPHFHSQRFLESRTRAPVLPRGSWEGIGSHALCKVPALPPVALSRLSSAPRVGGEQGSCPRNPGCQGCAHLGQTAAVLGVLAAQHLLQLVHVGPPAAACRLGSAGRSSGCMAPAPPPASNHGAPRPGTCPPARPACPAPDTPPTPAPRGHPGRTWRVWGKVGYVTPSWLRARASRFRSSAEHHHHVPRAGRRQGRPCADLPTDAEVNPLVVLSTPQKIFKKNKRTNKLSRLTGTNQQCECVYQ